MTKTKIRRVMMGNQVAQVLIVTLKLVAMTLAIQTLVGTRIQTLVMTRILTMVETRIQTMVVKQGITILIQGSVLVED
jgi:hypothetical protein